MRGYDLNLLRALKALVEEGGATAAARRLQVSEATMSRHLAQLRKVFGDPVLVRSGRDMAPSSRKPICWFKETRSRTPDILSGNS